MGRQTAWGPCAASSALTQQWGPLGNGAMPSGGSGPQMMHAAMAWGPGLSQGVGGVGSTGAFAASSASATTTMVSGGGERALRALNGWTVVWVGERAFRAPASVKEQIESIGFLVKIYRSHDKCSRALDKKNQISQTNVFVMSELDAEPLLRYLQSRGARNMHFVVDADGSTNPAVAQMIPSSPSCPEHSSIVVVFSWEEVLGSLRGISIQATSQHQSVGGACLIGGAMGSDQMEAPQDHSGGGMPIGEDLNLSGMSNMGREGTVSTEPGAASDTPWTLVWVSDQAFKPAAGAQKAKLEALGCQVKGYKTHKNAARALDKKRALVRTVVLVSGAEAAPFLAYLVSRPEIGNTPVVVEASSRTTPVRESTTCKVADSFDAAVAAVWQIAADPGFT